MLTIKNTKSNYRDWYHKNKQQLAAKRKKLYAENPEYRQRALEASKRYRRGERTPPMPPDAPISFSEAAERLDVGNSTMREWRRKKLFPEPKHHKGQLFFTENQVSLLRQIKHILKIYKMRPKRRHEELKKLDVLEKWS